MAPRPGSRGEQIARNFARFHEANPAVWHLFVRFTNEAIAAGHKTYSADAIVHRIRWHTMVETRLPEEFKINDHYVSYYARLFMTRFPNWKGFFKVRVRRSDEYGAFDREPTRDPDDPKFVAQGS